MVVEYRHWIGGRPVASSGEDRPHLDVRTPTTGRVVGYLLQGGAEEVATAVTSARNAQAAWAALTPTQRGAVLVSIAEHIEASVDDLCALECDETGKPEDVVRDEITGTAEYFRFYGHAVRTVSGQTVEAGERRHLFVRREPLGVVGIITPWNYAVNQAARGVAPALAAGNAVVLKPSEFASTTILEMAALATAAGLPGGLLNVVLGAGAAGAALVEHRGVAKVTFTGSVDTGRRVAVAAAQRLAPVTLELGGKSPHLVFADADLDAAARDVAGAGFYNAGQTCSAGTRLLVEESIHDEFVDRLAHATDEHRPGAGGGPIITGPQFDTVLDYLAIAEAEGAIARTGGLAGQASVARPYIEPTIYTGVRPAMRIAREEVFGPVVVVLPFRDEAEAVRLANDSEFGLVAGLWTRDLDRSFRVAHRLESGQVFVNGWGAPIDVPFGGTKLSGFGREKGLLALEEYSRTKGICFTLVDDLAI